MIYHYSYLIYFIVFAIIILMFFKFIKKALEFAFKTKDLDYSFLSDILPFSNFDTINDIDCLVSKNNIFSIFIKFSGYSYYASNNQNIRIENAEILNKFFKQFSGEETINIKIFFIRDKDKEGFKTQYIFEINNKNLDLVTKTANDLINKLNIYNGKYLNKEEILRFQYYLINKSENIEKLKKDISKVNISNYLAKSEVTISNKHNFGELYKTNESKYFQTLSIVLGEEITSELIEELLKINGVLEVFCNITLLNHTYALKIIEQDENTLFAVKNTRWARKLINLSEKAIEENVVVNKFVTDNSEALVIADFNIILCAQSLNELSNLRNDIEQKLARFDVQIKEEKYLTIYTFFARLAGFKAQKTISLRFNPIIENHVVYYKVVGSVIAAMVSMPKLPTGIAKNDWGNKPLASFRTNYNNEYNFNLHEDNSALAHSIIIASSGGGKTTLFEYLIEQALKNYKDLTAFSFDSFNGMTIFTDYLQGYNIDFQDISFNPFQIDLTDQENYDFAVNLLKMMTGISNTENLKKIVDALALLPIEDRILANEKGISYPEQGPIYEALSDWVDGSYKKYFNAREDKFNLDNRFVNFQMNAIIKDEKLSAPIIYCIMHKIYQKCKEGMPHFIFLDEAAALIDNPIFSKEILRMLNQHRKLRGSVNLAFQSPSVFLDSPIRDSILINIATIILLGNTPIDEQRAKELSIPNNQLIDFQNLTNKSNFNNENSRWMLVKKNNGETLFLDINLKKKIGDNIAFYTSSSNEVARYKKLKVEFGDDWKNHFLKKEEKAKE